MLIRILLAAMFAGVLAGVFATGVQSFRVVPLIIAAEQYESEGAVASGHDHSTGPETSVNETVGHDHSTHDHGDGWAPADGLERTMFTVLANIVVGVAYSLLLVAAVLLLNQQLTMQSGLVWGAAGFAIFVLAPNFGLPPELPGMPAGDLVSRQLWWALTAAATACALALFAFKRGIVFMLVGLVLVVAPHVYGAPQPVSHETAVPASLAAEFVVATMVASLLFWLFLGGVLGEFFDRAMRKEAIDNAKA